VGVRWVHIASEAAPLPLSAASMAGRGVPRVVRCRRGADVQGGRAGRLRCAALIAMMKATDFRDRDDRPVGCSRDRSVIGRVLLEAKVRSAPRCDNKTRTNSTRPVSVQTVKRFIDAAEEG
jgi:hypothetical protein